MTTYPVKMQVVPAAQKKKVTEWNIYLKYKYKQTALLLGLHYKSNGFFWGGEWANFAIENDQL